ncbi:MAG: AMP-binding protein [Elusimicrobia bacterium]|nr:AMP-binding protein [Elusimicrobiota bacterium]
MKQLLLLFKNRGFTGAFLAHTLSVFNDNIFRLAFVSFTLYKIFSLTDSRQWLWMFIAAVVFLAPVFLFSVFAGEVSDKTGKDTVIKYAKFIDIIIFGILLLGLHYLSLGILIFTLFLKGTETAFFGPVKYGILEDLAGRENLLSANANFIISSCAAIFLGVAIGPALIQSKFFIYILGALTALAFLSSMLIPAMPVADKVHKISFNFVKINILNARLVLHSRDLFLCTLGIAWFWLCASVFMTQIQAFTFETFAAGNHIFSYLLLVAAAGVGVGAIMAVFLLKGEVNTRFAPLSVVFFTIFILDLAWALSNIPHLPEVKHFATFFWSHGGIRVCIDIFFTAFFGGIFILPVNAMLQAAARDRVRSRMVAVCYLAITLFILTGGLISFILYSAGAHSGAMLGMLAAANTIFSIAVVLMLPKHIIRSVITAVLDFFYRIEITGLDAFKNNKNNAVIVANQNSLLDPLILAVYLPGRPFFVVDSATAAKFWIKPFLKLIRYYTVDPENPLAVRNVIEEVKRGNKVVVFPEGRVSTTGGIMKIHPGLAMIAERSGADIIPVSIEGSQYSVFSRFGKKFKDRPDSKITVNILPARKLKINENLKSSDRRAAAENELYDIMAYMKYRSSKIDQTIFNAFIDSRYRMGYRFKLMNDITKKEISFGSALTAAFVLGRKFKEKIKPGGYAGVLLPTSSVCSIVVLALHAFGRVPAMINFSTGIKNVCDSCKTAGVTTVYTATPFIEKADMQPMVDALAAAGVEVIFLDKLKITLFDKLRGLAMSLAPRISYHVVCNVPAPTDPAVLLFTSGSEGTPKGVVLSHRNVISDVYQVCSVIPFNYDEITFCAMPLFHSYGFTAGFILPAICGFKVFFYPSPLHYHVIPQLVYETNATILYATDTFLAGYAKVAHPYDFYSLRYVAVGAEKLKESNLNLWARKFGLRVLELYGATEAAPAITSSTPMHYQYGSVGRMLPGMEYKIKPVPGIEKGGELVIKGDNVMLGYIKADNPGVIQPPQDGWYETGDIVEVDENGFVFIKGRAKRFAKIAGEMIPMLTVETEISLLWPDSAHAVVSVPDEKRGEKLVLYTTQPDAAYSKILEYLKSKGLPEIYAPRKVKIIEAIPLIGTGKADYVTLTQRAVGEEAEASEL